jgi:hypothetical protein
VAQEEFLKSDDADRWGAQTRGLARASVPSAAPPKRGYAHDNDVYKLVDVEGLAP